MARAEAKAKEEADRAAGVQGEMDNQTARLNKALQGQRAAGDAYRKLQASYQKLQGDLRQSCVAVRCDAGVCLAGWRVCFDGHVWLALASREQVRRNTRRTVPTRSSRGTAAGHTRTGRAASKAAHGLRGGWVDGFGAGRALPCVRSHHLLPRCWCAGQQDVAAELDAARRQADDAFARTDAAEQEVKRLRAAAAQLASQGQQRETWLQGEVGGL